MPGLKALAGIPEGIKGAARGSSIYAKLLLAFLITVLPIFTISLITSRISSNNVKEEMLAAMESRVAFSLENLEKEIGAIAALQISNINNDDISNLAYNYDTIKPYEFSRAVNRLYKNFVQMKNTSSYIEEAGVYIDPICKIISTEEFYTDVEPSEIRALHEAYIKERSIMTIHAGKVYLLTPFPEYKQLGQNLLFLLYTRISEKELKSTLASTAVLGKGGAVFASIGRDWFASAGNSEDGIAKKILDSVMPNTVGDETETIENIVIGRDTYMAIFKWSKMLNAVLVSYIKKDYILGRLNRYRTLSWIVFLASLVAVSVFSYWIYRLIHSPLKKIVRALKEVESGNFHINIKTSSRDEFGYLFGQFNKMADNLKKLIYEVYENKILSQKSELKFLQSQINPHFLYNSFMLLSSMVRMKDYENIQRLSRHLGDYFQYIARSSGDMATLEQELKHAKAYAEIQSLRFGERIAANFAELPEKFKSVKVPKLIIQPVVENAYNHGLKDKTSGGRLVLGITEEKEAVLIHVEDNGESLSNEKLTELRECLDEGGSASEATGLLNVHRRLKLVFGEEAGLVLERSGLGGMKATVRISCRRCN